MSKLELILLGQFDCLLPSGKRISLPMRKAEVLLAYLALTPGIRHPRERLINLLWSDRGEEQARNSLRQCLSAIRKSLEEAADLVLQVDRNTVCLNAELAEVDIHEFERLADEGDYESLTTAADLYQGEFLEGISIRDPASQEWLDNERARFKRQFIEILSNLTETQLVSHDFKHAIQSAERLVKQDPLGENGWRLLMRSYHESGDRNHALLTFKRCQQALREELGVEPEAPTVELREQISAGNSAIPRPIEEPSVKPEKTETPLADESAHSIAVLPFDNLSGDPEQEYFSDGITDSIILNLSLFPGLNVKSRNSSFAFKQQIKSLGEISRELDVDYIVEGSIRRSADRIRITVQLIEAASGNQVWGKRYDAELNNLFDLEEELSRTIAATVTGQIESDLQRIAVAKGAAGQESYDLLLIGFYHAIRFNRQDSLIAIEKLNQCLAQDPDNVRANVYLYSCHSMNYLERWVEDYEASFRLAQDHIEKALALDPGSALVQAYYAEFLIFNGELDESLRHLDRALEINPNDADALTITALNLEVQGEFEAALEMAERSHRLDPYHPWVEWELAVCRYFCGQYQAALKTIENARTSPSFTRIFSVAAYVKLGRIDEARQALQDFLQLCRKDMLSMPVTLDEWTSYIRDNYKFRDTRDNQDIIDCLLAAGLEDELKTRRPDNGESHSIAVLPFDNLSGDPAQEYFSDGITESIILNLSLFPELNVKSRNSSFAFKQQIKSLGDISRELEVDYIVEGSIRKTEDRVRVTVQLVDATSGNQVWGKRYDAEIENLFDLEEELSRTIAATVTGQIESDLQRIAMAKGAAHQQSYDLLLQGIYYSKKSTAADTTMAIEKLHQCLELDPGNALAHATLYGCHELNWIDRWVPDFEASRKLCKVHASKALELNPNLGQAQVVYAEYLIFNRDYSEAEAHLKRALEINPNDSEAIATVALNLSCQGKFEAALEQARLALRLDPYHTWARWILTESQFFCGLYEDVLETVADTGNPPGFIQIYKIAANIRLGRIEIARDTLKSFLQDCRESMASMPRTLDEWLAYSRDNAPFADPAINQEIIDCLLQAGLGEVLESQSITKEGNVLPSILVLPFSNLSGDPEQEYFSDGITDSIIVSLSTFDGLKVKSRHTSNAFRESPKSIDQIGAELGVQYVVEGSVRKIGDNVRITVQLDETASGDQIWGKRFDSPLEDLFSLEEELVQTIAGTVSGRIGHETRISSMRKPAKDLRSYDYLMRGTHHLEKFNADDSKIAKEEFSKCLEIDPQNADAHAQLAVMHAIDLFENWTDDRPRSIDEAAHHLHQAIQLEPENAFTHAYLAEHQLFTRDFKLGLFHADKSIELNPTLPDGYSVKSYLLAITGHIEAALTNADTSMKIDPYSYYMGWNAGEVYRIAGQYQRAIDTFRSIPHMSPSVHAETAACLVALDRLTEARAEMQLFRQQAREQMATYPQTEAAWRRFWYETTPYQNDADFDLFYGQLMQAGLCDDIEEISNDMPSIAVLPFENMSGDPEQEHFSDGITADLISTLFKFRNLRTVSFYSTQQYKSQKASIAEIAAQQRVRYILKGSVRKSGDRIRVNVELIDSSNEQILWSERFDRDLDNMFTVQDEITRSIALAMKVQLDDGEMALHRSKGATSIRAWELTLTAADLQDTHIRQNVLDSRVMAKEAIEIDPEYAFAWITLAWAYWEEAYDGWSDSIDDSIAEAEKANLRARSIDPDYGEAWIQAGMIYLMKHEPEESIAACIKAVELEPGNTEIHALTAYAYIVNGDYEKARDHDQNATRLCPIRPGWYYLGSGLIEQHTGNPIKAAEFYRKGLEVEPDSPNSRYFLIDVEMELGNDTHALQLANEVKKLDRSVTARGIVHGYSYDPAQRERFRDNLAKFDLV